MDFYFKNNITSPCLMFKSFLNCFGGSISLNMWHNNQIPTHDLKRAWFTSVNVSGLLITITQPTWLLLLLLPISNLFGVSRSIDSKLQLMLLNARGKSLIQLPVSSPIVLQWIIDSCSLKICPLRDFVIYLNFLSTFLLAYFKFNWKNSVSSHFCITDFKFNFSPTLYLSPFIC